MEEPPELHRDTSPKSSYEKYYMLSEIVQVKTTWTFAASVNYTIAERQVINQAPQLRITQG